MKKTLMILLSAVALVVAGWILYRSYQKYNNPFNSQQLLQQQLGQGAAPGVPAATPTPQ